MSWALLQTVPNDEFGVARRLDRFGFENLLVKRKVPRIWHGRRVERLASAFPRYVFVVARDAWEMIRNITGVVDFVRIGQRPAPISDQLIDGLRSQLDESGALSIVEKSRFYFGQRVVFHGDSIVSGHEAVFQYPLSHGRVCVLQKWLNQWVPVEIGEHEIIPFSEYRAMQKLRRANRRKIRRRHVAQAA